MSSFAVLVFLNVILIIIESAVLPYLADGFFARKSSSAVYCLSFGGLVLLANLFAAFLADMPLPRISCFTLSYSLWIFINHKATVMQCVFSSILIGSFQTVIDNIFLMSAAYFSHGTNALMEDPYGYYAFCYGTKLFELLVAVIVRNWAKNRFRHQAATWLDWLRVLFFPLSSLLIAFLLYTVLLTEPHLAGKLLVCTLILLLSDFASILLLNYLERQQNAVLDNTVLRQNLKMESEHIRAIQESYASQRKQTHDFQNQLAVLRSMAEREASQKEFSEYLSHILAIELPVASYVSTQRMVVDVILSQKCAAAKSKDIDFQLQLDNLADFPLSDDALVIVLTNLIDNAIEACEKISEPSRRRIVLKMQTKPAGSYLYIENTTAEPVYVHENRILTTKSNPLAHGYGLKNVCTMLDRHSAQYAFAYQESDGVFRFSAKIASA